MVSFQFQVYSKDENREWLVRSGRNLKMENRVGGGRKRAGRGG